MAGLPLDLFDQYEHSRPLLSVVLSHRRPVVSLLAEVTSESNHHHFRSVCCLRDSRNKTCDSVLVVIFYGMILFYIILAACVGILYYAVLDNEN